MADAIAPDGSEIYFLATDASRASLVEVVLQPGRVTRPVRHRTVEEIWYFLSGAGQVWLLAPGGHPSTTRAVGTGDFIVIPTGWAFQFRTTGDEALRFLCFTTPPWPGPQEAVAVEGGGLGEPNLTTT
jgi:mannose-6-phosphate isomerase-like protein (cupin superfamily)